MIAFHGMGGNIADGLAPLVVGALLAWLSWRTVVVVNVVPGLVMAAMILVMLGAFTVSLAPCRRHQCRGPVARRHGTISRISRACSGTAR